MKKLLCYLIVISLFCMFASCEKAVQGLNVNPNNPTDAPAPYILTGAEVAVKGFYGQRVVLIGGMWSGYMVGIARQALSYQNYVISPVEAGGWTTIYNNIYNQLGLVINKYEPQDNQVGIGISEILQSLIMGTAAGLYGDIPFSQANNLQKFPSPIFDPQLQVYDSVQGLLDKGITALSTGIGSLPEGTDIFFDGNPQKWTQVAYTLKARFYLAVRDYTHAIEEAEKGIATPANSLMSPAKAVIGLENALYANIVEANPGDIGAQGAYLTTLLDPTSPNYIGNAKTNETARFNYYFVNLGAQGLSGGIEPNYLSVSTGKQFNGIIGMDAPAPLVTYQENLLILAEATARIESFDEGLAYLNQFREYMESGGYIDPTYTAAFPFKYEPYTEADFQNGGMINPNNMDEGQALLKEILQERYITFYTQLIGFDDVRRTRKEAEGIQLVPATGNKLPERIQYDETEIDSNPNVPNPLPGIFDPTPVNE